MPAQTVCFVSADALSDGTGSKESPFATLDEALRRAETSREDVVVYLREGVYRLTSPLRLTNTDSTRHLTICNYPGERVVLSGSEKLELVWENYKDGIKRARLQGRDGMDMLVVDGKIRPMARYPNYDSTAVRFNGTSASATDSERIKAWRHPEGGYLHVMHERDWGDFHYRIAGKTADGKLELEGGHQNNRPMGLHGSNRMVENVFEELDAPGEWYYDAREGWLYYYPETGEKPDELWFEAPRLKSLAVFDGDRSRPVWNVTLRGLELAHTVRTFMEPYEPLLRSDWMIYRGGAVVFRGTVGCAMERCLVRQVGGNAVFFDGFNRRSVVSGCHFTQVGASGICFVGDTSAVRSPSFQYGEFVPLAEMDFGYGPKNDDYPASCRVHDNLIHDIGLFEKQVAGVELSMCRRITVCHNSIYDTPRAAVNISEGTWGGHVIEHNDLFDTVKETGDHGSINSWGRNRFWHPDYAEMRRIVERHPGLVLADALETNVIRHNRVRCDRGWDIDLDDGSSNYWIYDNLCLNGGIKLREGFCRTVENNILVNNTLHPHLWFRNSGDIFTRNIVMRAYQPIRVDDWGELVDYNVFADSLAYGEARRLGLDEHSVVARIEFAAPLQGDFRVADTSVAVMRGGFRNFPMDGFGVVSPRLKELAACPVMPVPMVAAAHAGGKIMTWKGVRLKNLETLGERSATGMDEERGVYVISVDALGCPLRDVLQPNDVILEIESYAVDDVDGMMRVLSDLKGKRRAKAVLMRNQKPVEVRFPL